MSELSQALNLARLAKAINANDRDVPANAALVVLAAEVGRLQGVLTTISEDCRDPMFETAEIARRALEGE